MTISPPTWVSELQAGKQKSRLEVALLFFQRSTDYSFYQAIRAGSQNRAARAPGCDFSEIPQGAAGPAFQESCRP